VEPKIDSKELADIVEQAHRIQERASAGIDGAQARQVLRELDLSPALLDEARAAVAVARVKKREREGRLKLAALVAAILLAIGALAGWRAHARSAAIARISTSGTVLAVNGAQLANALSRATQPELSLEVVLARAPTDDSLELSCDWRDPSGQVRYQNHWQTKTIDKPLWPTHCRHRFNAADASGEWSVSMSLAERVLASERFTLE